MRDCANAQFGIIRGGAVTRVSGAGMPREKTVFSKRLRMLRVQLGVNQKVLGITAVGLKPKTAQNLVSRWETSRALPTLRQLMSLCDYFGVSMDSIMGRAEFEAGAPRRPSSRRTGIESGA